MRAGAGRRRGGEGQSYRSMTHGVTRCRVIHAICDIMPSPERGGAGSAHGGAREKTARIHSQEQESATRTCHVYCLGKFGLLVTAGGGGGGGGGVQQGVHAGASTASQRTSGGRRDALQTPQPAVVPPVMYTGVGSGRLVGVGVVVRFVRWWDVPRRHPRALVTGRRALSLLLCGQMWALLRKPAAGRSQRAGLVKRRGWGCGAGAVRRRQGVP